MLPEYRSALQAGEQVGKRYVLTTTRQLQRGNAGTRLGRRAGDSQEFMDHRDYQPGDDLRRLNWNAYARSDRLIVTLHQEEISPHLELILDSSESMRLTETRKAEATLGLVGALCGAANNANYTHRLWLTNEHCELMPGSQSSPGLWPNLEFSASTAPIEALKRHPPAFRPHSTRIFVSDFLFAGEPRQLLEILSRQAALVVLVQILTQSERHPPLWGSVRLQEMETGQLHDLYVDEVAVQQYRMALANHIDLWHDAARHFHMPFLSLTADELIVQWQLTAFVEAEILQVR